ncbi:MAG TPA: adenylate/guanylate cyclase domain-containing protein [Solirubrobacteraceae bacterium]|nr:adenylate/guanylate cyclase domain-containing protein [Solirubrobacteraceae bacterium]
METAAIFSETRRRLASQGWLSSIVGALVVFVAIGFFIPLFASSHDVTKLGLINAPLVVLYAAVSGFVIHRIYTRDFIAATGWIAADRAPETGERDATLTLAIRQVKLEAAGWVAGALVFAVLNGIIQSWGFGAVVGATIWLGGETTCALDYLLTERLLRPVIAHALVAGPPARSVAPGVRARLIVGWALGTGVPLIGVLVVGIVGLTNSGVSTDDVAGAALFLGVVASFTGAVVTRYAAHAIGDPLLELRDGLARVERGEFDVAVSVDDLGEIGLLQAGFNRMADGLREREQIRDLFGRQVGAEVARAAVHEGVRLGGEERPIGALFIDMVGSTALALAVPPAEVVATLNSFFHVVVDVIEQHGGLVNKFEGDGALCVFGAPVICGDPAGDALRAARVMAARFTRELPKIDFGIGVSAGAAVAGNVGAEHRFEYTVIGDPVNEASRLADLAKERPERVLASDAALRLADPAIAAEWDTTGAEVLRGRSTPTGLAHPRS